MGVIMVLQFATSIHISKIICVKRQGIFNHLCLTESIIIIIHINIYKKTKAKKRKKRKPTTECNLCLPMCNYFIINREGYPTKALTGKKQQNKKNTHTHTYE